MTLSLIVKALLVPLVCAVSFTDLEKSPLLRMEKCTQAKNDPFAQWSEHSLSDLTRFGQPRLRMVELMNSSRKALLSSQYNLRATTMFNDTVQMAPKAGAAMPQSFVSTVDLARSTFFKTSSVPTDKPVIKAAPVIQRQQSNDRQRGLGLLVANQVAVTPTTGSELVQGVLRRKPRRASSHEAISHRRAVVDLSLAA